MALRDVPRLLRTAWHLQPSQLFWRGRYALRRRRPPHVPIGPQASALRLDSLVDVFESLEETGGDSRIVAGLAEGTFEHLNECRQLGLRPDWGLGRCTRGRLWTVTLHYHRWAYDLACAAAEPSGAEPVRLLVDYLDDWQQRCGLRAPGARELAWNAYAIATRIGWWIRSLDRLRLEDGRGLERLPPAFVERFKVSFWEQSAFLSNNVEWDLRGNHLVRDAVGLAWAGRVFEGPQAALWSRAATRIALSQAEEQVLADGGHFERSPMYHCQVANDFAVLYQMIDDRPDRDVLQAALLRMGEFACWARHPDGGIPLLNDASLEAETTPDALLRRLGKFGLDVDPSPRRGGRYFSDTGLAVWHGRPWSVFFDVGPVGPEYQPGHAHADTLTIECSWNGMRLFVDPGTHSYDQDARRTYDRSTAAHNTVCVDDADSSEVWHIFRVGRRAKPRDVVVQTGPSALEASAAHDGYRHLGNVVHRRHLRVSENAPLVVIDRVEGDGHRRVEGGWLIEPGWSVATFADGWEVRREAHRLQVRVQGPPGLEFRTDTRPWHPAFGIEVPATRLTWQWSGELPLTVTTTVSQSH